jgi:zinc/manganese transport system substrate-binding protein
MRLTVFCVLCVHLGPAIARAKLFVVATTPDLGSIATEIGGDRVEVTSLARPTEDPHFVDARPSFIRQLNRADALVEGGAELEIGWLPPLLEGARNPKVAAGAPGRITCSQGVSLLEVPAELDRSKGDVHAMGNPHFMTDPLNGKIAANHICEAFCALDTRSCQTFRANLAKFQERLEAKMSEWATLLEPYRGTEVVAYHNTWPYFGNRFGLKIDLFLEPKPGIPPTPASLADVIAKIKADHIRVIIVEPYQNRKTAETVARETGASVLDFAQYPGGVKGAGESYIDLIDYLVRSLAAALGGGVKR